MRALIYIMTPVLILTFIFASRFVTWEKLKGVDSAALKHLTHGTQLLRNGKSHKAISALTKAIEIEPKYAEAYIKRGLAYSYLAYYKKAIADYNQTLSLNEYSADAYASRGDVYLALGDETQAINDYTASLKKRKNALVMSKRAKVYLETGKISAAIDDYSNIVKHRPSAIAYHNRGRAYYQKFLLSDKQDETLKLALTDFDKAIELQPSFAIAYLKRGDIHAHLGQQASKESDYSHAIALLTDAIQNWQNQAHELIPIYLWRAVANKKSNYGDKALNDIQKVYELFAQFYLKKISISDILSNAH
ncbi:MAG: tetratricopeptide repeat protein [Candidatus Poribacteria bacterium]|nr:tetratricopeptide repeat protein [Candidatus Poribacteria bacterium]